MEPEWLRTLPITPGPCSPAHLQQFHTCPEGQAGVATVDATEGFAHELHDAVDLGLDVSEADVRERVAVLVDVHGTCGEKCSQRPSLPVGQQGVSDPAPMVVTSHTAHHTSSHGCQTRCQHSEGRIKHLHHKALHTSFKKTKQTTSFGGHDSESRHTRSHILL